MQTKGSAWMRWVGFLTLTLLVTGCGTVTSDGAICDATKRLREEHTAALLADGGPTSTVTGANLIQTLDAGCKPPSYYLSR